MLAWPTLPAVFRNGRMERRMADLYVRVCRLEAMVCELRDVGCAHNSGLTQLGRAVGSIQTYLDIDNKIKPFEDFPRLFGKGRRQLSPNPLPEDVQQVQGWEN